MPGSAWESGAPLRGALGLVSGPHPLSHHDKVSRARYSEVSMSDVRCHLCERTIPVHESFVVRMDVLAVPSLPPIMSDQIESADFDQTLSQLLYQMQDMTAAELQDGVHRLF